MGKNRGLTLFAAFVNRCLYPVSAAFDAHSLNRSYTHMPLALGLPC